jgi:CHAT domain-containing protein/tetratricopeptide (TPR) repeat protein
MHGRVLPALRRPLLGLLLVGGLGVWLGDLRPAAREPAGGGLVVEAVEPGGAAATAGLQPGDVLLRWRRADASAPLSTPLLSAFDLRAVEIAEAPRGEVILEGRRNGAPLSLALPAGLWLLHVRPRLPESVRIPYLEGRHLMETDSVPRGAARWGEALALLESTRRPSETAWLLGRLGDARAAAHAWAPAEEAYRRAVESAEAADDPRAASQLEERWGEHLENQGRFDEALESHRRAFARWEHRPGAAARLTAAYHLNSLGVAHQRHGDLAAAERCHRRALEIRSEWAPHSLATANSYNNLGILAGLQGNYPAAERSFRGALDLYLELAPDSRLAASTLNNLAVLASKTGDLAGAEDRIQQAIEIWKRYAPDGPELAASWANLGQLAQRRGHLVAAEQHLLQALDIQQRRMPGSVELGVTLGDLAALALDRRDLDGAEDYGRRALEILERTSPDSHYLATLLDRLGVLARERGDLKAAEAHHLRSLEIRRRRAPEGLGTTESLEHLARLDLDRGDGTAAADHLRQALALERRLAPTADTTGTTLCLLGEASAMTGDSDAAAEHFQEALALLESQTADSAQASRCLHRYARFLRRTGDPDAAARSFTRAIDALEAQTVHLGGTFETRSGFTAEHTGLYRDYLDLLVDEGRREEAFRVLERSRARSFLDLLATRDLIFERDVPAELGREKRSADAEYGQILAALAEMGAEELDPQTGEARRRELEAKLDEARRRRRATAARIRAAAPRLAALRHPDPPSLDDVRKILGGDTLLLSYSVGPERSHLFALGPMSPTADDPEDSELEVLVLPWSENELAREVARFRRLLRPGRSVAAARAAGEPLTARLLRPVAERLARARRVVVIPDGPLHNLPFSALPEPISGDKSPAPPRWLVEGRAVSVVASVTVLEQLRSRPRRDRTAPLSLVAFGDPAYPRSSEARAREPVLRSVLGRGLRLDPLPSTRDEVESLRRLFPNRSRVYLGPEATEERVKTLDREEDLVHFACHGLLDQRFPLESALALTVPRQPGTDRDNGLLQAWEIFEQVRLDAELVSLSACDTGLGKELAGEGMLGLTRAFQYAGARSVLASLWAVGDRSTTLLMQRFYFHLKEGLRRDEALRRAQLDLLDGTAGNGAYRHPFHWAAFELFGDPS